MIHKLHAAMQRAIKEIEKWPIQKIHLFHHNDADGLSSGAILLTAFERRGYEVKRICLEKPYPALLNQIYEMAGEIIVFADFAGRIAPMISALNKGKNLTLILDHHAAEHPTDPKVHNLDPDLYGLKGDRDISASTTCYLFARALDSENRNLAHVAAIGAVGDGFYVDGRLVNQNREAVLDAIQQDWIKTETKEGGERYILRTKAGDIPCDELALYLELLGAGGYYRKGPDMGIRVCLEGRTPEADKMAEELRIIRDQAFSAEMKRLENGLLKESLHIQHFHVEHRFSPMGVKMIGAFCQKLRNMEFVNPRKYIAGFQVIPNKIPGFGPIEFDEVKISMRVPVYLEEAIKAGRAPGLDTFLPEATNRLGGFSDACHSLSAATTIALGKEDQLVVEMDKILSSEWSGMT